MDAFLPNFSPPPSVEAPTPAPEIKPAETSPLAKPLVNGEGDTVSPETLAQLKSYIEQTVVMTVSQAVTTIVPDVVEATLAKVEQPTVTRQPASALPAISQPLDEDFVPGIYQGRRAREVRSDLLAWLSMGGIVVVMAGVATYALTMAAPAQTTQVVEQQTTQIKQQNGLIQDLAKEAAQAKCRAFCF